MISFAIACQKCLGHYFLAISGNLNFYYLFRICYYLKLPLNSKIIWGAIFRYIGRLRPPPPLLFVWMHNESVMNAWPELGAKRKPLEYAKTTMNPSPPQKKENFDVLH